MIVILAWLFADFISGVVHWWEDRALIGASRFEFINSVRRDNERHHKYPGFMLRLTWWQNIQTTAPFAWAIAFGLALIGAPMFFVLTAVFIGFGNLVHRLAHEHPDRLPLLVRLAQFTGFFQSASHHAGHHFLEGKLLSREESSRRYCVMTNWLNPALDRIRFWTRMERVLLKVKP